MNCGLADLGVLVADDARVVGGGRGHHEGRDRRRNQGLQAQVLDEILRGRFARAGGEDAGEIAVERVAHQVGHARGRPVVGLKTTIAYLSVGSSVWGRAL